ncbi:magnesium transporter [Aliikangiella coralliicola]|uniref:Magnesium transporter MgtE n=1 Tax=Aliikangiella coralliicola TaxID=2592383 RepID=A0A545UBP9_9GAMM|nr:magnesium transporter [Aliikangiella coralliicola]TQV86890.1 magnesium transporter [Aliikangiella coralliicola]
MPILENFENEYSSDHLQQLNEALQSGMFVQVRMMLNELPAADVAHFLESTPPKERDLLWRLINTEREGQVLQFLDDEIRNEYASNMDPAELAAATRDLDIDNQADILGDLPDRIVKEVLASMRVQDRHRIEHALGYPEDSAGGLMNTDVVTVRPLVTIEVVLRYLRMKKELPDNTDSIYVVDSEDKFIGAVKLSSLIISQPEQPVDDVLDKDIQPIPVSLPDDDVARLFERRDLISAPVIDENGKLLGRITIDDVVDVIIEDADHSLMSMAGLDENDDTFAPIVTSAKRRAIWLGINLITVMVAVAVIGVFEDTIKAVTALAILQPIVPSMGGIAGTQTLTLVIRGLSVGHISSINFRWLMLKELGVSVLNGLLWALVVGLSVYLFFSLTNEYSSSAPQLGITIAGAMIINLVVGATLGAVLPMIMTKMKIDPALSGGVVLTTVTDMVGFFSFLGLATLFFA